MYKKKITYQKQTLQPSYWGSTKRNPLRFRIRSIKYSTADIASSTDSRSPLVPRAFHISQNLAPSTYDKKDCCHIEKTKTFALNLSTNFIKSSPFFHIANFCHPCPKIHHNVCLVETDTLLPRNLSRVKYFYPWPETMSIAMEHQVSCEDSTPRSWIYIKKTNY